MKLLCCCTVFCRPIYQIPRLALVSIPIAKNLENKIFSVQDGHNFDTFPDSRESNTEPLNGLAVFLQVSVSYIGNA